MEIYKFKTSAKCGGCVSNIGRYLDEIKEIDRWNINLNDPMRILEVSSESDISDVVMASIRKAGYKVDLLTGK